MNANTSDLTNITIPMGEPIPATRVVRAGDVQPGDVIVRNPDRFDGSVRLRRVERVGRDMNGYVRLWTDETATGSYESVMGDYPLSIAA